MIFAAMSNTMPGTRMTGRMPIPLVCLILASLFAGASARGEDRIVLRNLDIVRGRTVRSFDLEGVLLDDGRLITWDEIEKGTVASQQAKFDEMLADVGPPLYRVRQRLKVGDYAGSLADAEAMYGRYADQHGKIAYLVAQGVMWGRISAARREEALEPYLRCFELLRAEPKLREETPGVRRIEVDPAIGLCWDLLPIWFNAEAAKKALPGVQAAARAIKEPPPGIRIYYASLLLASGDEVRAARALDGIKAADGDVQLLVEILAAQREIASGTPAPSLSKLAAPSSKVSRPVAALARYVYGSAQASSTNADLRQRGLLELLSLVVSDGRGQPDLAAACLKHAQNTLMAAGDRAGAAAVGRELIERYGGTYHGLRARDEVSAPSSPPSARIDDGDGSGAVERFLTRLGLGDQLAFLLEEALTAARKDQQDAIAQRLADLYAGQLLASSDDEARYARIQDRIRGLLGRYPAARTPILSVILLQADYKRGAELADRWLRNRRDEKLRDEAGLILRRLATQLGEHRREITAAAEILREQVDRSGSVTTARDQEKRLLQFEDVLARATFFDAWSHYYLGVLMQSRAATQLAEASKAFRELLEVNERPLSELKAEYLGLDSVWRARAMIGLALTSIARGDLVEGNTCFALLESQGTSRAVVEELPFWRAFGLASADAFDELAVFGRQQVPTYTGKPTSTRVSVCRALVEAACCGAPSLTESGVRELASLGLTGLARMGDRTTIRQLIDQHPELSRASAGFLVRWLQGEQQFAAAEKSKRAADFGAAGETLAAALAAPDAASDPSLAARCRYELAWCWFQTGQHERAFEQFQAATAALREAGDASAVEAAWMQFVACQRAMKTATGADEQKRIRLQGVQALRHLQRDFPDHEYARRAQYQLAKLSDVESPESSIANLERVPPGSPNYLAARHDLCLLLNEQWLRAPAEKRPAITDDLRRSISTFLAAAKNDRDAARKLTCLVMLADVELRSSPPNVPAARAALEQAAPHARSGGAAQGVLAEYHYRWLQLAQQENNTADVNLHARWLADHAEGSSFELPGLLIAAKQADESVRAASDADRQTRREQARCLYERLSRQLGDSVDTLRSNKNAQVAVSKHALYRHELGEHALAAELLEQLLAAFPKHQDYLRRAGLARFSAGQHAEAGSHFRTLVAGVPGDSEAWFEARYYQLSCLAKTDRARARQLFQQHKLLHPKLAPESWRARYEELAKSLQ